MIASDVTNSNNPNTQIFHVALKAVNAGKIRGQTADESIVE
jgi:hypothetical protein